jgi:nitrile hydratase subunit beta
VTGDYVTHADLGGKLGHPPIKPEPEYEPWHAGWERRAMAPTLAMGATGVWNLDMSRAARETLPDYGERSYYEIWIGALVNQLEERGLVSADELAAGHSLHPPRALPRILRARDVPTVLARGTPTERMPGTAPRFRLGQRVRTVAGPTPHHTRLPGYAKGKLGVIERLHGMHVFADANASGQVGQPQWLYTVVFSGAELWADVQPGLTVSIDAWEPYLETA